MQQITGIGCVFVKTQNSKQLRTRSHRQLDMES